MRGPRPWTFIHVTDMQPGSPRSFRYNPAWAENWETARRQIIERRPEFLLVGGDVSRDGSIHRWELEEMKASLEAMEIPYRVIPGNMDTGNKHTRRQGPFPERDDVSLNITSEQLLQFESVFGPSRWTFIHRNVRVSGLCDMVLGSGLTEEARTWEWLNRQQTAKRAEHHFWLIHYPLFIDRLDEPRFAITRRETYYEWYFCLDQDSRDRLLATFKATGATRVVSGHVHCRMEHVADGIHFDLAPATCGSQWTGHWAEGDGTPGFLEYLVDGDRIAKRFVPLDRVSTRTDGYGPGGHPRPEQRDYSLAWKR